MSTNTACEHQLKTSKMSAYPYPNIVHEACFHAYVHASHHGPNTKHRKHITNIPHPTNGGMVEVMLHPRWCKACAQSRMLIIGSSFDQVQSGIGAPYSPQEEVAFNHGIQRGRRAAICLDMNLGPSEARVAVIRWSPTAPYSVFDLLSKLPGIQLSVDLSSV